MGSEAEPRHERIETDPADSTPGSSGPHGVEGDLGISSERTQAPHDVHGGTAPDTDDDSVEGTGSLASTVSSTDGASPVEPTGHEDDPSAVREEEVNPDPVASSPDFDPRGSSGHSHG